MDSDAPWRWLDDRKRYEILGVLGEGGMGMVYKATTRCSTRRSRSRCCARLRAHRRGRPRFRSEIKLARKVSHRNVCRIHEYGEDGQLRYLSMELIDGDNLKQAVRGKGGLPLEEAARSRSRSPRGCRRSTTSASSTAT
jgi:serine/threonine-protein kinase